MTFYTAEIAHLVQFRGLKTVDKRPRCEAADCEPANVVPTIRNTRLAGGEFTGLYRGQPVL